MRGLAFQASIEAMRVSGSFYGKGRFAHDPFKVDLVSNTKVVFVDFFEAVFLVEMDRFGVFAKDAHINFRGFD